MNLIHYIVKKFLLAAVFFAICSHTMQAQGFRIGLNTGMNTNIVLDEGLNSDPRYQATYNYSFNPIGVNLTYDITPSFGLSLESILSHQKTIYDIIDVAEAVKGQHQLDMRYVNIPLLFKFMSGGDATTRFNFNLGPQLSILTQAQETLNTESGTFQMPQDASFEDILVQYPDATQTSQQASEGTYTIPENVEQDVLNQEANEFKNTNFQLAMAMGLDFDIARHFMLTTQIRANYSIDGYRNADALGAIINGTGEQIFAEKAHLAVGIQIGLHYTFNLTRAFARKEAATD
jgi:hypothetical protein